MKRVILLILTLVTLTVSIGGCYIGFEDGDRRGDGHERGERHERGEEHEERR